VFSGPAIGRLKDSVIREIIVTDTIAHPEATLSNLTVVSLAPLIAETIRRVFYNRSVSDLF
jgi:ribose-phosphate pyrophosphokinase